MDYAIHSYLDCPSYCAFSSLACCTKFKRSYSLNACDRSTMATSERIARDLPPSKIPSLGTRCLWISGDFATNGEEPFKNSGRGGRQDVRLILDLTKDSSLFWKCGGKIVVKRLEKIHVCTFELFRKSSVPNFSKRKLKKLAKFYATRKFVESNDSSYKSRPLRHRGIKIKSNSDVESDLDLSRMFQASYDKR